MITEQNMIFANPQAYRVFSNIGNPMNTGLVEKATYTGHLVVTDSSGNTKNFTNTNTIDFTGFTDTVDVNQFTDTGSVALGRWKIGEDTPTTPTIPTDLPEGLSIVDGLGNVIPADNYEQYDEANGLTGIGVNSNGHKFIFAVADTVDAYSGSIDDGSISTRKYWSSYLWNVDVPGLTNYTDRTLAESDFASKANTDAIIEALGETIETNNAAVVARSYSAGVIGQGQWDLLALGILRIIWNLKSSIQTLMTNINKSYWNRMLTDCWVWSSTEANSEKAWLMSGSSSYYYTKTGNGYYFVIHVYTIA